MSAKDIKYIEKKVKNSSTEQTLGQYLQSLVDKRGLKDSEVYKKANISKEYWNKLINDKYKNRSKYKLILISIALELPLDEVEKLFNIAAIPFNIVMTSKSSFCNF